MENVVGAVIDLAAQADRVENTDAIITAVVANAQEQIAAAERTAEQIAAAAMESERGQEIARIREEFFTWQNQLSELRSIVTDLSSQMGTLTGQVAAAATLAASSLQSPASSLSTLPLSETVPEAIAEVEAIIPANLASGVVENPVPQIPAPAQKRRHWI